LLLALGRKAPRLWRLERYCGTVDWCVETPLRRGWEAYLSLGWKKTAGLLVFGWGKNETYGTEYNTHFCPCREHWGQWGAVESWYDGPMYGFYFGPFLQVHICWTDDRLDRILSWLATNIPNPSEHR